MKKAFFPRIVLALVAAALSLPGTARAGDKETLYIRQE